MPWIAFVAAVCVSPLTGARATCTVHNAEHAATWHFYKYGRRLTHTRHIRDWGNIDWLEQHTAVISTTAVTEAEILCGLRLLPDAQRHRDLEAAILPMLSEDFSGRVLPFDREATDVYGAICTERRRNGRPISPLDAHIAAITLSRGAALATRNMADFECTDLTIINPWDLR